MESIKNEKIKKIIQKWCEKKSNLIFLDSTDNILNFRIGEQIFKIHCPHDYPNCQNEMLFIDFDDLIFGYTWMSHLNSYIFDNKPNLTKLLSYIDKLFNNFNKVKRLDFDSIIEDDKILDDFDIEEIKFRKKLEDKLLSSKSSLTVDLDSTRTPILFGGKLPGHILINDFLSLQKNYKSSSSIKIELLNENIYDWKIIYSNFSNKELNNSLCELEKLYGYNNIEINIQFHDKLYPSYPPFIKIIRPTLNNNLMHRITNLKMVQLDYWSPCRENRFIIDKLYQIINLYGTIDINNSMNDKIKYPNGSFHELGGILVKLASLCDFKDDHEPLDDTDYPKIYNNNDYSNKTSTNQQNFWKPGTGYGTGSSSNWNIKEYLEIQKEKDIQIQSILQKIIEEVQVSLELISLAKILECSYFLPFIKNYLDGTTMLEIGKHKNIYKLIFSILQNFANEDTLFLFTTENQSNKNLYEILTLLNNEADSVIKFSEKNNANIDEYDEDSDLELSKMILILCEMLKPVYNNYVEQEKKLMDEKLSSADIINTETDIQKIYFEKFDFYKFSVCDFVQNGFKYTPLSSMDKLTTRRLAKEFSNLKNNLPIFYQSSIFVCVDDKNSRCFRVLITGSNDTPYDSGIFIFDVYIDENFPKGPPKMSFINHGNKRFNPNLYNNGKVCLSLLGTWRGVGGEEWNEKTSTIQQLLISVQSQILVGFPYFNEPGWESRFGSEKGDKMNKEYNNYIRYYTMCHAMCDILLDIDKNYTEFGTIIKNHFIYKKNYIMDLCKKWVEESMTLNNGPQQVEPIDKKMYEVKYQQLQNLLENLIN
ncbi:Ubiquitin-conjugating enzyme E2 [uncultured virus]|nr:Ubiquitin-conjugating enzyme E2 [uncultured virus]